MTDMLLLTTEAMFLRGVDVGVSPLLLELLETTENTVEVFFLRRPFGFLPSSSVVTCTECRIGATSPSLSELEPSLNKAGSKLTFCARPRLRGPLPDSGDVNKASARRRSGIRTVAVLRGDTTEEESRCGDSQSDGVTKSGEEDFSENGDGSWGEGSGRSGMLSWM